jgi:hypothetical protein
VVKYGTNLLDLWYSNDNSYALGIRIWGGLQGKVPGTDRIYEKAHEWVQVACVSVVCHRVLWF